MLYSNVFVSVFLRIRRPSISTLIYTLFPYTTLVRSRSAFERLVIGGHHIFGRRVNPQISALSGQGSSLAGLVFVAPEADDLGISRHGGCVPCFAHSETGFSHRFINSPHEIGRASCRERVCQSV